MNVTLIGMAGAGKSFIGEKVAKKLGLEFLDIDRMLLEPEHDKPLQDILDELGDEKFTQWEERAMIDVTKGKDGLLISTPGSVAYEKKALEHFKKISSVIYLQIPFATIEQRVGGTRRGIVGLGSKSLRELYDERTPIYEQYADFVVETGTLSEEEIVEAIVAFLEA